MISFNIINTFLIEKTKKRGQNLVKNYLKIIIMKNENKKMFFLKKLLYGEDDDDDVTTLNINSQRVK